MRLQRFLARAGVASRRGSERLMTSGRVRVNGVVVSELGSKVDPSVDVVTVDGRPCSITERSRYIMLYKPQGYITTMSDPQGRPTVAELVPSREFPGLFPVGRLDSDTTGLLLFTTNGNLGQELLHPSRHVDKHYVALVRGVPTRRELEALRRGVMMDEGPAAPAKAEILHESDPLFSVVAPHGAGVDGGGNPNSVVGEAPGQEDAHGRRTPSLAPAPRRLWAPDPHGRPGRPLARAQRGRGRRPRGPLHPLRHKR